MKKIMKTVIAIVCFLMISATAMANEIIEEKNKL